MKASTERTIKTLVYLVIVAGGAYWAYGNVLPIITRKLQEAGGASTPTAPTQPSPTTVLPSPIGSSTQPSATTVVPSPSGSTQGLGATFATGLQSLNQIFADLSATINKGLGPTSQAAAAIDGDVVMEPYLAVPGPTMITGGTLAGRTRVSTGDSSLLHKGPTLLTAY